MNKKLKKILITVFSIVLVAAVLIVPQKISETVSSNLAISAIINKKPLFVAHRGLSSVYPQNTVPAFEAAVEKGFYGYELDVHTTSDGRWVVIHNDTVDAMTDGEGEVEGFTFEEIRRLRIDAGNGIEKFDNLIVPTLEESLEVTKKSDIVPFIEIKKCDVKYLPGFLEILEEYSLTERCVVISFEFDYLLELQKLNDKIELMYLTAKPTKEEVDMCSENGNIGFDFQYKTGLLHLDVISYAKEKGLVIGAWTVDNTIDSDLMRLLGVKIITTNRIIP